MNRKTILKLIFSNNTYRYALVLVLIFVSFLYFNAQNAVIVTTKNLPPTLQAVSPILAFTDVETEDSDISTETVEPESVDTESEILIDVTETINEVPFVEPLLEDELSEEVTPEVVPEEESVEILVPEPDTNDETLEYVEEMVEAPQVELPYLESIFTSDSTSWFSGYGDLNFTDSNMVIGGGDTNTAFLSLLGNAEKLSDYEYNVTLDWNQGESVQLIARFADYGNFVACSYGTDGSGVSIVSTTNGERTTYLRSGELGTKSFDPWKNLSFGMRVEGRTLVCLKDEIIVLSQIIPNIPLSGGVGIALWSEITGESLVTVKEVQIKNLKK